MLLNIIYGGKSDGTPKWKTLIHNGVLFPPEYKYSQIPLLYDNKEIILLPEAEEYAYYYSKYLESEYIKSKIFNNNFWKDWRKILKNNEITDFSKCNFSKFYETFIKNKEINKNKNKEINNDINKYKLAIVDGKEQKIGNFLIEPPGLFIGRGCHPKIGRIKWRIYPSDIIINISDNVKIPIPMILNNNGSISIYNNKSNWGEVIHDNTVEWIARWNEPIMNKIKYVWLAANSTFKANSDIKKFELARKLKQNITKIRDINNNNLINSDIKMRQIATVVYLIDKLAIRAGNEKGEDEADTVGATSLRFEHLKLIDNKLYLDFLGKDSVRYKNSTDIDEQVHKNLDEFMKDKQRGDLIFDSITTTDVNKYLQSLMNGLTAKLFRTFNSSNLMQNELDMIVEKYKNYKKDDKMDLLLLEFNKANSKIAVLCNHQKNITKSFNSGLMKINEMIKNLKEKIKITENRKKRKILKLKLKKLIIKKEIKIELSNVSLGTSIANYIDIRIIVAWIKKFNIPIDKILTKTLQDKFSWAMDVDDTFVF